MKSENHVLDLLPAYSLEILSEAETTYIDRHLAGCEACRSELFAYQEVADQLSLAVAEREPPEALKTRLIAEVQKKVNQRGSSTPAPKNQSLRELLRSTVLVMGLASLLLSVVLLVSSFLLWQRANQPPVINELPVVELASSEYAPQAAGLLVMSRDSRRGTLVVDGLPFLDETQEYQLWLVRGEERISGGTFSVNEDGYGYLRVSSPGDLLNFDRFGVTIEPAGGSLLPTGPRVLGVEQ